jgi:hypothetical protein
MRLPLPFYRLPIRFDIARLRAEVDAIPASAWANHPNQIVGNSSVRLISMEGGDNDDVDGRMQSTAYLLRSPYMRQILASFGVVWGRSRLMRLAPRAIVPPHADINYHWFNRVRLHIPVTTSPEVRFYCDQENVHMAAGEAWVFDNWRRHRVENPAESERIHLVADTSGSSAFWNLVLQSRSPSIVIRDHQYDPQRDAMPLTERTSLAPVMAPAEIDLLIMDLRAELAAGENVADGSARLLQYHTILNGFCRDWRQLYLLYGSEETGWNEFTKLRDSLRNVSLALAEGLVIQSNRVPAHKVLEGRVLRPALSLPQKSRANHSDSTAAVASGQRLESRSNATLHRPIFIIAAPRSGSTLLFESLASSSRIATLGGEAHRLVEDIPELRPDAAAVDSNRLDASHVTAQVVRAIKKQIFDHMQDSEGHPLVNVHIPRFLEKTPKNALRIPFFNKIFPDAQFVFLWRDPRENLSSIIEAWASGNWKTYNGLSGFDGPWSMILPPGWRAMNGKAPEEIAAFQWNTTNQIALDDLAALPADRCIALNYSRFLSDPAAAVRKLCVFFGFEPDARLIERVSAPLPWSRYTQTPPAADKWRRNEAAIDRVLPSVDATWRRLMALA